MVHYDMKKIASPMLARIIQIFESTRSMDINIICIMEIIKIYGTKNSVTSTKVLSTRLKMSNSTKTDQVHVYVNFNNSVLVHGTVVYRTVVQIQYNSIGTLDSSMVCIK